MKAFILMVFFIGIPGIAWLPARLWTICGDPWCLNIYPAWLDKITYTIARPYLDQDIGTAAEQMDFLAVWISSVTIMQLFMLIILFLYRDEFNENLRFYEESKKQIIEKSLSDAD